MAITYEKYANTLKEDGERSFQELRWKMCTAPAVTLTGKNLKKYTMTSPKRDLVELM
jgi:hypothetical protein